MKFEHINHNSTRLLIFFAGFYTDADCFVDFDNNKSDILFIYDYSDMDFEEFDFTPYTEINLMAYSYGVWAANKVFANGYLPDISNSVAIAGTFFPVDNNYGINPRIYDLMLNNFDETTIEAFEKNMMNNCSGILKKSTRTVENLKEELYNIKAESQQKTNAEFQFDKVLLTKNDKIFPYSSQENFWSNHNNKEILNTGHFPFYEFDNFDEILN